MILVPFCSLLLAVMAAHFVLGPIGWTVGSWISAAVYAGISGSFRVLFGAIFGFFYAPLVITGLHHMSNAIDLQLIADFGGTMLWPMIALSNIAQGSAVLGMIALQRKNAKATELNIPSCISCYLGVTEPAMFVLSIQPASIAVFALCMLVAVAVPFTLTYVIGKRKGIDKEANEEAALEAVKEAAVAAHAPTAFCAFLSGKTVAIEEVPDATFAEKVLGDGIAIDPTDNTVVAPADSVVVTTMPGSDHAVGLSLDNGIEILIHVGLDTVAMNGDGFTCHVKEGDRVKAGQKLITFDPKKIKAAGHPTITMMVVTDAAGYEKFSFETGKTVRAGEGEIVRAE